MDKKWSEEDDKIVAKIVDSLMHAENVDFADYRIMYNWLISIKERVSCENSISIGQNMNNIMHCSECKLNFRFADSDIIEDAWVVCPDCGNKICILE